MIRTILVAVGAVLVVAGVLAFALGGVPYTDTEEIIDIGSIEATAEVDRKLEVPPLVAGLSLAVGVGMVVAGLRSRGG